MTLMKYLPLYSGKDDPETWLETYQAAAKSEGWKPEQIVECISLKLKKKARDWYYNLSTKEKPKTWEQVISLFLEEFGDEDLQTTLARCYRISQKKSETLKKYLSRYQKYLKKHDSTVRREVANRYIKQLSSKSKSSSSSDETTIEAKKQEFINNETERLAMHETTRVETFISGLRHYRSHFLITDPSSIEDVRRIVQSITRKKQWSKSYKESDSEVTSDESDESGNESEEDEFERIVKKKSKINPIKRKEDSKFIKNSYEDKRKSDNNIVNMMKEDPSKYDVDKLIQQFSEMKIMLAETVSKVNKLTNNNNNYKNQLTCRNCQASNHDARDCTQPCKVCKGTKGSHPFWKCPDYPNLTKPLNQSNNRTSEHVLLETEEDYDYLEDLFAYEDNPNIHSKKRVRVEDIEDEDDAVRFVSSKSDPKVEGKKTKSRVRSKPVDLDKGPTVTNKAAKQLMEEAKISLTLEQICELAPGFRVEVRKLLVRPRKSKVIPDEVPEIPIVPEAPDIENIFINKLADDENGNCPRTLVTVNNKCQVNALLDGGATPNIISLDLIKRLGIKELTETQRKYITANGESSQALGIAQDIILGIQGRNIRISAIVYNHDAFPLLLGRKTLKKLKISTNWEKCDWYMNTNKGSKMIPVNFNTDFGVKTLTNEVLNKEKEEEELESDSQSDSEWEETEEDPEIYTIFSDELKTESDNNQDFEIIEEEISSEISTNKSQSERIIDALSDIITKIPKRFQEYVPKLRDLCMEFIDIFGTDHENLKQTNIIEFDIDTGDSPSIFIKPRPLPYKYKEFVKGELEAAVKADIMEGPLKDLNLWGYPVWAVSKPKTNEMRMVGDFRLLNERTLPDIVSIPDLQETIEQLATSQIYSPLDFLKAFHQIKCTDRAKERLVLSTEFGNYRYKVMPFGVKNAPATFAKAMSIAFSPLNYKTVAIYFDDATVHSKDAEAHLLHLRETFEIIRKYNFTLRLEKCSFFQEEIELLGYKVSPNGIKPIDKLL